MPFVSVLSTRALGDMTDSQRSEPESVDVSVIHHQHHWKVFIAAVNAADAVDEGIADVVAVWHCKEEFTQEINKMSSLAIMMPVERDSKSDAPFRADTDLKDTLQ